MGIRQIIALAGTLLAGAYFPSCAQAETIVMKSGEKIQGTVIEKNSKQVRVDYRGAVITYRTYEIATIDGKPLAENVQGPQDKPLDFLLENKSAGEFAAKPVITTEEHVMRGVTYYNKNNPDQAIEDFNKAIKLNPKYAAAYMYRGLAYGAKDDFDKAMADYNKAITLDPKSEEAHYIRGLAYASKKEADKAMADYNKAIELNPKYVQAYLNRCVLNISRGKGGEVVADVKKVLEINPRVAMAYFLRGVVYANENNIQQAIADYTRAIELNQYYVEAYVNRALAYAYKDKVELSKIDPNSPKAFINVGAEQINKVDFDRAIADCDSAIEIAPKYADAYVTRARINFLANKYDKVWEDVRKVQEMGREINPGFLKELETVSGVKNGAVKPKASAPKDETAPQRTETKSDDGVTSKDSNVKEKTE